MKKMSLILMGFLGITLSGQNCKPYIVSKLRANGPDLLESKTQIKYGTPLCIEVSGVNTFLMKTQAKYTPINFDFSTKGFLDIKLPEVKELVDQNTATNVKFKTKNTFNLELLNENTSENSRKFKEEFTLFQSSFSNINRYITLKNILLKQITKDSIFINDTTNFKKRSASTFKAIYKSDGDHLKKKKLALDNLNQMDSSYIKLVQIYEQLNMLNKKKDLKLSGELKDGQNVLKFDKIAASFETKYLFEDEMKKVKIINDSLTQPKNRIKIIEESHGGIDLYDEIQNATFKTTIISENVYDDTAKIKPQLKNSKGKVMYEYREFKVNSYGNWKINGSAGYFLNFISDDNYQLRKKIDTDSSSKTGVLEINSDVLKHSLGGLLHAYYNFKGALDAGFSFGLSINDNANAGFYLGLSAFFTETNRLVLTSGISFIKVKKLNSSNLGLNTSTNEYDFRNETDTEIKFDDVYQPSFFIGISYNLF